MNDIPGINLIPEKYRWLVMLLVLWGPLLTRAAYRITQGGGLRSILAAFWLGTNTPSNKGETSNIEHRTSNIEGDDRTLTHPLAPAPLGSCPRRPDEETPE